MRRAAVSLLVLLVAAGCGGGDERVVVAAGTTLVDSGFIGRVLDDYPGDHQVSVVGTSSREALALGSSGSAELLITHLPGAENDFLAEHPGAVQGPIFTSRFVIVGPDAWRPVVDDAVQVFRSISVQGHPFVSRGDGSGTAAKEQELWELADVDPTGRGWYTETGQGMGFTLQVADQRDAITVAEIGSYLGAETITLVPLVADDDRLSNPYRITLVEDAGGGAEALFDWLGSDHGRQAIRDANVELFGEVIYAPTPPGLEP